jgi:hypothetical protein
VCVFHIITSETTRFAQGKSPETGPGEQSPTGLPSIYKRFPFLLCLPIRQRDLVLLPSVSITGETVKKLRCLNQTPQLDWATICFLRQWATCRVLSTHAELCPFTDLSAPVTPQTIDAKTRGRKVWDGNANALMDALHTTKTTECAGLLVEPSRQDALFTSVHEMYDKEHNADPSWASRSVLRAQYPHRAGTGLIPAWLRVVYRQSHLSSTRAWVEVWQMPSKPSIAHYPKV